MTTVCKHIHLLVRFLGTNSTNYVSFTQIQNDENENNPEGSQNQVVYNSNNGCENQNSAIEVISAPENFDGNYLFKQLTENVNSNLQDIKSNLLGKAMALCDLIKNCNNKDLLLSARGHINSGTSVLKT